ncbi:hypothetical protein [Aliiroseovarius sp. YM-037]|uniref:hypothetical protein n=1 Tax=Aliiroseovarius sp. YM-037 TaxID=3341728 RepID=UPI003A7FD644
MVSEVVGHFWAMPNYVVTSCVPVTGLSRGQLARELHCARYLIQLTEVRFFELSGHSHDTVSDVLLRKPDLGLFVGHAIIHGFLQSGRRKGFLSLWIVNPGGVLSIAV